MQLGEDVTLELEPTYPNRPCMKGKKGWGILPQQYDIEEMQKQVWNHSPLEFLLYETSKWLMRIISMS